MEQHTNSVIFEGILKTHIPPMSYSATEIELSTDEENIIRYAAGYVPLNIMKKYEKQSSEIAAECIECLMGMSVSGDDSSFQAYLVINGDSSNSTYSHLPCGWKFRTFCSYSVSSSLLLTTSTSVIT